MPRVWACQRCGQEAPEPPWDSADTYCWCGGRIIEVAPSLVALIEVIKAVTHAS